jgi:lauroyl/myristoyl acyltransferase
MQGIKDMQNDHFNPHTFGVGAAVGVGALAFSALTAMQTAAQEIQAIVAERSEAERWVTIDQMFTDQAQRFAEMKEIMALQDRIIDELTANVAKLTAALRARG